MRRIVLALVFALVLVAMVGVGLLAWALPAPLQPPPADLASRTPDVTRGGKLAIAGDCSACHTRPGGAAFAGGVSFRLPFGVVYSSNITPDRQYGIGGYSLAQFIRLMRQGVAADGRRIYPAMPYTEYTKVSDADLQDIYAWFQSKVRPVAQPRRTDGLAWPLSMRWPLAIWDKVYLDNTRFQPDARRTTEQNRGAYLVEGLGHCGTCHTPRGLAIAEKATSDDGRWFLSGAELDGQSASDLRADTPTGLKGWSEADIVELLRTARTVHAAVAGQMSEVVVNSTQHMSDSDLHAIAAYLKSLGPSPAQRANYAPDPATHNAYLTNRDQGRGAREYMDSCAACHRLDGKGYDHAFPSLAGNATVLHNQPDSLVTAIVVGARLPSTAGALSPLAMPALGWRYSDAEIADLVTFVRSAWGNRASPVSAGKVGHIRRIALDTARQR